ncbi:MULTISPECIES: glycosyl transferase family 1 [Flavobacteriaceae]|uniref:glycosyl transferase family 1 n=1 Tax=Flavobacteriaceae TaxID=49546 RepID=UPI001490E60F|nr:MULTISPECIES: glycosyl transferase family 1 [Allomuricauda]MDC6364536.1 glycosyl transferase family 1 [Muricauda sp. AC10]
MQKVLVIAYYWPPAGGPGVQRWLKFVKYLPDFGIEPIVYVPENPSYPILDEKLVDEIPKGIKVLKQPIKEPYAWASILSKKKTKTISSGIISEKAPSAMEKVLLWVRGNLFIPDARKFWVKPSITFLSKFIQQEGIQTIITTGPPHSLHLIGLGMQQQYSIQWIADFRDPWTSIGYHKRLRLSQSSQAKHKKLEKQVLTSADKLLVTSTATKEEFEKITDKPVEVITNGYDDISTQILPLDANFTISHIGSLLTGRNPVVLWKVLADLVIANEDFAKTLKIQLAGVVGEEVLQSLHDFNLMPYVNRMGYLFHDQIVTIQQQSQVLLLLEIDSEETRGIIPGKLFEYMNAERPILAIGPEAWEAGDIIKSTNSGSVYTPKDANAIKDVLLDWFHKFQEQQLQCNSKGIEKYHRKQLTEALAKYIQWESS